MNDLTTSAGIRAELSELALLLKQARDDVALYERMTKAKAEAARIVREADALTAKLSEVSAAEHKRERDVLFSQFGGIEVAYSHGRLHDPDSVLHAIWTITYKRLRYDPHTRQNVMTEHTANSFQLLPSDVYTYLMEAKADALPSLITDLCPGDPHKAMERYFLACSRGYLTR